MVTVPWHANANRYSALTYGFLCLFLLTTLGSVLYATYKDRETQLERYSQRVQGNALVYEDQITQTLQWVENMMRSLPEVASLSLLEAQPQTLTPLLQKLQYSQPALRSFSIYTEKEGIRECPPSRYRLKRIATQAGCIAISAATASKFGAVLQAVKGLPPRASFASCFQPIGGFA